MLQFLPESSTIYTNCLVTALEATKYKFYSVVILGGQIDSYMRAVNNFIGNLNVIKNFNFDYAFTSPSSVDKNGELYVVNVTDAQIKREVLDNAKNAYALVVSIKFNKKQVCNFTPLKNSYTIITTEKNLNFKKVKLINT